MCIALPLTLSPIALLHNVGAIDDHTRQKLALDVGQMCARLLLKMMPFYDLQVTSDVDIADENPEPRIWVSNHVSMLDTFVLLASDLQLRGPNKRPIKVIYWKGLESNPVTNLMFTLCGFIPVDMAANAAGAPNEYDIGSFKTLLRKAKKAFEDGFDILVLPEGQLNPWPENGLLDIFPGAYKLSLMSKRKIQLVAMHGTHRFWHADESIGMTVTGKEVKMRAYSPGRSYKSAEDFMETFRNVVGHFGKHGEDLPENELRNWLSGGAWRSNDTSVISANSQMCTDDVEKEILSVLQRENSDEKAFNTLAEANECRQPIGVYTKKSPLIIHELVSSQVPLTA
jgi:1-acyl-sn-glycerol-3-phosphate acyltransferase